MPLQAHHQHIFLHCPTNTTSAHHITWDNNQLACHNNAKLPTIYQLALTQTPNNLNAHIISTVNIADNRLNVGFFINQAVFDLPDIDLSKKLGQNYLNYRPKNTLSRQDFLWQKTCFECFIAIDKQAYLEINANPHQYAVYKFDDYRTPNTLPPPSTKHSFDLTAINGVINNRYFFGFSIAFYQNLTFRAFNPTAIIYYQNTPHFFAHQHAKEPDFHHKAYWLSL